MLQRRILHLVRTHWMLLVIVLIAFGYRWHGIGTHIEFAYDQGRDFTRIYQMLYEGDLKIVGPETDIPGVFNGVLYYHLLLFLSAISNSNIVFIAYSFAGINALICVLLYKFCIDFFEDRTLGLTVASLWAISFEQVYFARFISNASMMIPTTVIFFMGLAYVYINKKPWGLFVSAVGYALAIHVNFYLLYLGIFYVIFFVLYRPRIAMRWWTMSVGVCIVLLSPYFVAEYKWKLHGAKSLIGYFYAQMYSDHTAKGSFIKNIFQKVGEGAVRYEQRIAEITTLSYGDIGLHMAFALFVISIIIFCSRAIWPKNHAHKDISLFVLIWALSSLPLFYFSSGVLSGHVINTPLFFPVTIIFGSAILMLVQLFVRVSSRYLQRGILIIVCIISLIHLSQNQFGSFVQSTKEPMTYSEIRGLVEHVYADSNGAKFEVCALTNPLFINTLWSFAFKHFGEQKYGYLPYWSGQPQHRNRNFLPTHNSTENIPTKYLILEPPIGMKPFMRPATIYLEDLYTEVIEEKSFGQIVIQKRKPRTSASMKRKNKPELERIIAKDPRYSCNHRYD